MTELYVKPPWDWMKNRMYALNDYWYRRVGISRLAVGNTLLLQRAGPVRPGQGPSSAAGTTAIPSGRR
jgi:hypothetical protein